MREKKVWTDEYRDIPYEINQFELGGKLWWTYYLYIRLDQMPEEVRKRFWLRGKPISPGSKHIMYDYYKEPLIENLDWHAGCTWYSKHGGHDSEPKVVQIGCDYSHAFDEQRVYDLTRLDYDARKCIDSLHDAVLDIKRRCQWCGEYFDPIGDEKKCPTCGERDNRGYGYDEPALGEAEVEA